MAHSLLCCKSAVFYRQKCRFVTPKVPLCTVKSDALVLTECCFQFARGAARLKSVSFVCHGNVCGGVSVMQERLPQCDCNDFHLPRQSLNAKGCAA